MAGSGCESTSRCCPQLQPDPQRGFTTEYTGLASFSTGAWRASVLSGSRCKRGQANALSAGRPHVVAKQLVLVTQVEKAGGYYRVSPVLAVF